MPDAENHSERPVAAGAGGWLLAYRAAASAVVALGVPATLAASVVRPALRTGLGERLDSTHTLG